MYIRKEKGKQRGAERKEKGKQRSDLWRPSVSGLGLGARKGLVKELVYSNTTEIYFRLRILFLIWTVQKC